MQEQATQQNSQIIDRLLGEQQYKKSTDIDKLAEDNQVLITTSRVVSIRYRIYFIALLLVLVIFGNNILLSAWDDYQATKVEVSDIDLQIANFQTKKLQSEADKALIQKIEDQQTNIISCLNTRENCATIDPTLRVNFSFARSYIQLNNLTDPKMFVNEKILLANINEYLLREPLTKARNGLVNKIAIGEPKQFFGNLYYVPLKLNVTFDTKDALLSFIDNVEKRVFADVDYRVLYKIDKVNYDIANYTTQQKVDVDLNAYYYID
ncbi:MAG TPA: hypothetical protein PKC87_04710 [Candidatus Absconditabacterales bacterium]|nr:hypothetical protein [Candidatus Absconditabacterales bacterium]